MITDQARQQSSCLEPVKTRLLFVVLTVSLMAFACSPSADTKASKASTLDSSAPLSRSVLGAFPEQAKARAAKLLSAIESEPDNANRNGLFAMYANAHGLSDVALDYYLKAAQLAPEIIDWPYLRGVLLSEQGESADAIEALRQATSIDPNYPPLRLRLAQMLIKDKQLNEARTLLEGVVKEFPNYPQARWTYGQFEFDQRNYEAAIEQLNFAVAQVPHYGSAHYTLAAAYRAEGEDVKSATHLALFEKYNNAGPVSTDALVMRVENMRNTSQQVIANAARLSATGKFPQAIDLFNGLLQKEPDNAVAHINLIGLHGEMGQIEKAEEHYKAGLMVSPNAVKLHNNYGVLMLKTKNYVKAAEAFREAIKVDSEYAKPYKYLGVSLKNMGQAIEAQENFRTAFSKDPLDDQAGYLLADSLMVDKEYGQAVEILAKISAVQSPKSTSYLRAKAKAHYELGEMDKARDALNRARTIGGTFGQADVVRQIDVELKHLSDAGATTQ